MWLRIFSLSSRTSSAWGFSKAAGSFVALAMSGLWRSFPSPSSDTLPSSDILPPSGTLPARGTLPPCDSRPFPSGRPPSAETLPLCDALAFSGSFPPWGALPPSGTLPSWLPALDALLPLGMSSGLFAAESLPFRPVPLADWVSALGEFVELEGVAGTVLLLLSLACAASVAMAFAVSGLSNLTSKQKHLRLEGCTVSCLHRERERERDRQTDRQTDGRTDGQTDRQTDGGSEGGREGGTDGRTDRETGQTARTDTQPASQPGQPGQPARQAGMQAGSQAGRQTDKQTNTHTRKKLDHWSDPSGTDSQNVQPNTNIDPR